MEIEAEEYQMLWEVAAKAEEARALQNTYFKVRTREAFTDARKAESELDQALRRLRGGGPPARARHRQLTFGEMIPRVTE
jgi:hypothetical protein